MDTAARDRIQILFNSCVILKHLEAPTMRTDGARLFNQQPIFSDLPSCHPMTSQAAQEKTIKKSESKRHDFEP